MSINPLGVSVPFKDTFDASLLFPIFRSDARCSLGIIGEIPFEGNDVWTCFEVSWLDMNGIPQVAVARIEYPADSVSLIESKSLKLFLGSFNNSRFEDVEKVEQIIVKEVSGRLGSLGCRASLLLPARWATELACLDPLGTCVDNYPPPKRDGDLSVRETKGKEIIHSNLLRSLCPVTSQPDWGTVVISYDGKLLDRGSLVSYLLAHRSYQGFHEECCERLFLDISRLSDPKSLTVACFYTRRGGIDINPIRWMKGTSQDVFYRRLPRQ